MRCPKCGYISFDHLENCLKCKKNIKEASDALQGGVFHVVAPVFLNLQAQEEESEEFDLLAEGEVAEDEMMAEEFDIVMEEESAEESGEATILEVGQNEGEEDGSIDFEISLDEGQEAEITIDPGLFDDDAEIEDQIFDNQRDNLSEKGTDDLEIEIPEELVDMSDLAPPEEVKLSGFDSPDDLNSLDIDLDGLDFNLDSGTPAGDGSVESLKEVVSLGDIDFSDTIGSPGGKKSKKSKVMDMDDDLNFDLDLGGLSIHDDI